MMQAWRNEAKAATSQRDRLPCLLEMVAAIAECCTRLRYEKRSTKPAKTGNAGILSVSKTRTIPGAVWICGSACSVPDRDVSWISFSCPIV